MDLVAADAEEPTDSLRAALGRFIPSSVRTTDFFAKEPTTCRTCDLYAVRVLGVDRLSSLNSSRSTITNNYPDTIMCVSFETKHECEPLHPTLLSSIFL